MKEEYIFKCQYSYLPESFLMGNDARILVWPSLKINENECDLNLVWNIRADIIIESYIDNIPTIKSFENLKFGNTELELNFTVPPNLGKVDIKIIAEILKIGGDV